MDEGGAAPAEPLRGEGVGDSSGFCLWPAAASRKNHANISQQRAAHCKNHANTRPRAASAPSRAPQHLVVWPGDTPRGGGSPLMGAVQASGSQTRISFIINRLSG